jgi:hypothetical protein
MGQGLTNEVRVYDEEHVCDTLSDQPQEKGLKTVVAISSDMYAQVVNVIDLDAIERKERENLQKREKNISESNSKFITVTDDVGITFTLRYLIRENSEVIGYCDTLNEAINVLNRIAGIKVRERDKKGVKVFRRDLKDGKEVHVCTQQTGLWNGNVRKELILDTISVPIGVCY